MSSRVALVVLTIAMCTAFALDAACVDIILPPQLLDSGCPDIYPEIAVKNNGSESLPSVRVSFNIVRTADPADTVHYGTANSGQIGAGQTKPVVFSQYWTPAPGQFTMTGITELPGDADPHNDTCTKPLFVRHIDVGTEIVSPRDTEAPGLIAVQVRLTNNGNMPALVSRLDVKITAGFFPDYRENIMIGVGEQQDVTWNYWSYTGGTETCTAWITCPADMNHSNDTDVVIINAAGVEDWTEMEPDAGMSFGLSPNPLAGSVLHVEYGLTQAGPANVTLFDIRGRVALTRDFIGSRRGKLALDLRLLGGGVYLARLDDGHYAVARKLIVQR